MMKMMMIMMKATSPSPLGYRQREARHAEAQISGITVEHNKRVMK